MRPCGFTQLRKHWKAISECLLILAATVKSKTKKYKMVPTVKNQWGCWRKPNVTLVQLMIVRHEKNTQQGSWSRPIPEKTNHSSSNISKQRVKRTQHIAGLQGYRLRRKILLRVKHSFYKILSGVVLWSDNTKRELFWHNVVFFIWYKKAETFKPKKNPQRLWW